MPGRKRGGLSRAACRSANCPASAGRPRPSLAERHGLRLVRDITSRNESELKAIFGDGWRDMLAMARGEDDRPVETEHDDAKSYSQQETFVEDIGEFAEIERIAKRMVDELLRESAGGPEAGADDDGEECATRISRRSRTGAASRRRRDLEAPFYPLVAPLLRAAWKKRRPLRLVSVRFSDGGGRAGAAGDVRGRPTKNAAGSPGCSTS